MLPRANRSADFARNSVLTALRQAIPGWSVAPDLLWLEPGDVVVDRGLEPRGVFFPIDCVLSKLTLMRGGDAVEFATVGREGLSGASELLTGTAMPIRVICQVPGAAARFGWQELRHAIHDNVAATQILQRYTQSLLVQVAQVAGCNRAHMVEERGARWLLMTHDRVVGDEFRLTQEFLALMLGVRRARVNLAAGRLQKAGLIRYTRGRITVTDREGLEQAACECYGVIRGEYAQLAADMLAASAA